MDSYEGVIDIETNNIVTDIMDTKEKTKLNNYISKLNIYSNSKEELTDIYTQILEEDNVVSLMIRISRQSVFVKSFPEFYVKNTYGEDVINCQQNNSYHKYSVFRHILHTIEFVGHPQIPITDYQKRILKWTMLLHDIGKPYVKVILEDGNDSFAGHDDKSVELAVSILDRFNFSIEEKNIILTLIKYHDKFLNEGELTYDNMKFLANELQNNKELFYLLLDVKDADARAKNVEVYNKYKITKNKYLEFINSHFVDNEIDITSNSTNIESFDDINIVSNDQMSSLEYSALMDDVLNKKGIISTYQPIIDTALKIVHGYEVFTKINYSKNIDIVDFFNYAKEIGKFEKIEQMLLVNGIERFEINSNKVSDIIFVNIDVESYSKYINKPRIYDMMKKNKIVLSFHNYERYDLAEFKEIINVIHENSGYVALDNFGFGNLTIDDIDVLDIDYIIPDMSIIRDIIISQEKQKYLSSLVTYCIARDIKLIVIGIEDEDTLEFVIEHGVKYVQGYYIAKPSENIIPINSKIQNIFNKKYDEKII